MDLGRPVKNLLVDLDGTLLGNRNFPLSIDFIRRAFSTLKPYGGFKKSLLALFEIQKAFQKPQPGRTNDMRVVEGFARRMNLTVEEGRLALRDGVLKIFPKLERHFFPIEGAKEFLEWAKNHYPLVLTTNPVWPPEIVELRVKWAGLDPAIFRSITHVRKMHTCKPTLEYYEEILAQEGWDANDCLLIGNDVKMDLPATLAAIRVFIVGPFKEGTPLEFPKAKASAWKGSYALLKESLGSQLECRS